MSTIETHDDTPVNHVRWRWVMAALAPGLLSIALFASYMLVWLALRGHPRSEAVGEIGLAVLYGAMLMPLTFPFYLYPVGRRYVRVVHHGHKPVLPFVLMYGVADVMLWGAGALLLVGSMGWR